MKNRINKILSIVTIISLLSGVGSVWYGNYISHLKDLEIIKKEKRIKEKEKKITAMLYKEKIYKNENGILVKEKYKLEITIRDLQNSKDSIEKDFYLTILDIQSHQNYENKQIIQDSYTENNLAYNDLDDNYFEKENDINYNDYVIHNDSMVVISSHKKGNNHTITYVDDNDNKIYLLKTKNIYNKKGNKRFFIFRLFKMNWNYDIKINDDTMKLKTYLDMNNVKEGDFCEYYYSNGLDSKEEYTVNITDFFEN